jgi:2-oxoglutarate dehydrogenase E2 component (dihydrolipoamide succinyltransferase)
MATDVKIPTLGESISEATIAQWLKKPGDTVRQDEAIASLETDKVAVELNAPVAGVLLAISAEAGATVKVGAVVAQIEAGASAAAKVPAPTPPVAAPAPVVAPLAKTESLVKSELGAPMAPAVRRIMEDYNLDPASITGTGKDGRLTKEDVLGAIDKGTARSLSAKPVAAAVAAPVTLPRQEASANARIEASANARIEASANARIEERVKMTRLRQTIARRLKEAQNTAAMLTTFNDVDMTEVMAARERYRDLFEKKHGIRLGFMGFFVKAACMALKELPSVNGMIDGDDIVYRNYVDMSIAVSTPTGLITPVLRNADTLSFAQVEKTIADFGKRARDGQIKIDELQGGTFSITNGGVFGSLMSTPILNPPQSAILGMHRIDQRPVVKDGAIVARPMMYLAMSYDHRIVDGREAVTALVRIKEALEDPTRLLLDM